MLFFIVMTAATTATTALVRAVAAQWAPTPTYLQELDGGAPTGTALGEAIDRYNAWSAAQEPDQDRLWPTPR
jgi:hypothetical protein